jgi:hypothetical protein
VSVIFLTSWYTLLSLILDFMVRLDVDDGLHLFSIHGESEARRIMSQIDQGIYDIDGTSVEQGVMVFPSRLLDEILRARRNDIHSTFLTARSELETEPLLQAAYAHDRSLALRVSIENGAFLITQNSDGSCKHQPLVYDPRVEAAIGELRKIVLEFFQEINQAYSVYLFLGGSGAVAVEKGMGYEENVLYTAHESKAHRTLMYIEAIRKECLDAAVRDNKRTQMRVPIVQRDDIKAHLDRVLVERGLDDLLEVSDLGTGGFEISAPQLINKAIAAREMWMSGARLLIVGDARNDKLALEMARDEQMAHAAVVLHPGNRALHDELLSVTEFAVRKNNRPGGTHLFKRAMNNWRLNGNGIALPH